MVNVEFGSTIEGAPASKIYMLKYDGDAKSLVMRYYNGVFLEWDGVEKDEHKALKAELIAGATDEDRNAILHRFRPFNRVGYDPTRDKTKSAQPNG